MAESDTAKIRTKQAELREVDSPRGVVDETPSGMVERIVGRLGSEMSAVMVEQARAGKWTPWVLLAALALAILGALGWRYVEGEDECSPLVIQHVLHQAEAGEHEAQRLEAAGELEAAAAIRALTDVEGQPDDVRLCLLLEHKKRSKR